MTTMKPATPQAKRGTKPGTKQVRAFAHVCPVCGANFQGTAKATCCSPRCNLRLWRSRQAEPVDSEHDSVSVA